MQALVTAALKTPHPPRADTLPDGVPFALTNIELGKHIPTSAGLSWPPPQPQRKIELLLVGPASKLLGAVFEVLSQRGIGVAACSPSRGGRLIRELSPELVLLTHDCVNEAASCLAAIHALKVPLALLGAGSVLEAQLDAQSLGACVVIPKSPSVDALSERITEALTAIKATGEQQFSEPTELVLDELTSGIRAELARALSPLAESELAPAEERFGFRDLRAVANSIREFATLVASQAFSVPQALEKREPLNAATLAAPFLTDAFLTDSIASIATAQQPSTAPLRNVRALLVDDQIARADAIAQALRQAGAAVYLTPVEADQHDIERLRRVDPHVVLLSEDRAPQAEALLLALKRDARLCWASAVVTRFSELWHADRGVSDISSLTRSIRAHAETDNSVIARALLGSPFVIELEALGGPRLLRALGTCERSTRLTLLTDHYMLRVELSTSVIAGAWLQQANGEVVEGPAALAVLVAARAGSMQVRPIPEPTLANILAPIEVALNEAEREPLPLTTGEDEHQSVLGTYRLNSDVPPALASGLPRPPQPTLPATGSLPKPPRVPSGFGSTQHGTIQPAAEIEPRRLSSIRSPRGWFGVGAAAAGVLIAIISGLVTAKKSEQELAATLTSASAAAPSFTKPQSTTTALKPKKATDTGAEQSTNPRPLVCDGILDQPAPSTVNSEEAARLTRNATGLVNGPRKLEAESLLCAALEQDRSFAQAYKQLGIVYLQTGRPRLAKEILGRALMRKPGGKTLKTLLADAHALAGELEEARTLLREVMNVSPSDDSKHRGLSRHYARQAAHARRYSLNERAARLYRRAFAIDESNLNAAISAAEASLAAGNIDAAMTWSTRVLKSDPDNPSAQRIRDRAQELEAQH